MIMLLIGRNGFEFSINSIFANGAVATVSETVISAFLLSQPETAQPINNAKNKLVKIETDFFIVDPF